MEDENEITFRPLLDKEEDYQKLHKWCHHREVYEWFEQRVLSYEEIVSKYRRKLKEKKQSLWIIQYQNKDIGLVQIYPYEEDEMKGYLSSYHNIYEYDLFIGIPSYLSKGLGKKIIPRINRKIYQEYPAKTILLRPFKRNRRAVCCYEKSHFKKIGEVVSKDTLGKKETILLLIHTK